MHLLVLSKLHCIHINTFGEGLFPGRGGGGGGGGGGKAAYNQTRFLCLQVDGPITEGANKWGGEGLISGSL